MTSTSLAVVRMAAVDAERVIEAAHLFDEPPRPEWIARFLAEPGHHLLIAYVDVEPAGFVSGVEVFHPDKAPTMFVNELGVDERFRRQGIARRLLAELAALGSTRGIREAYVLTEADNAPAIATYAGRGVEREDGFVMFSWGDGRDA